MTQPHKSNYQGPDAIIEVSFNKDGSAAWYDYHGTAVLPDAWLCEQMAAHMGGAWTITARHPGGNGHEGAALGRKGTKRTKTSFEARYPEIMTDAANVETADRVAQAMCELTRVAALRNLFDNQGLEDIEDEGPVEL